MNHRHGRHASIDRYLRVVGWACRRYTRDGVLLLTVARIPTRYVQIESAAARRYL